MHSASQWVLADLSAWLGLIMSMQRPSELARLAANVVEQDDAHVSLASVPARRVMRLSGRYLTFCRSRGYDE